MNPPVASTRVAAIILAAGTSSRMGANKLLIPIDNAPMLNHAIDAALYSQACRTLVVVGHDSAAIIKRCSECTTEIVHNPEYTSGMASSIRAGVNALPADIDAALILLGDMPYITAVELDRLIDAHRAEPTAICVPQYRGRRGNPLLWPRRFFPALGQLQGDAGARVLLPHFAEHVESVEFDSPAILMDCDTPDSLPSTSPTDFMRPAQSKRY
jgi:molybdenum cofactor cytidylyltransferase